MSGWHAVNGWVFAIVLTFPVAGEAQAVPKWVSPARMLSGDGNATLQWSIEGDDSVPVFRIRERSRAEQQILFTDQAEFQLLRQLPGDYCYWVQTCVYQADGYPSCSPPSAPLSLTVLANDASDKSLPGSESKFGMACEPSVMRSLRPESEATTSASGKWISAPVWGKGEES